MNAASSVTGVPAVRPIAPVDGSEAGQRFDPSRTGVDLAALLRGGADQLVSRETPSAVALATVLERARASIVRGDPGDALAALDEAWDGAMRTEGGWYYRAAALALLGLPGEADRVLQQALIPRGGSVALLFLQSVVRSGLGDSSGARDALSSALARKPADSVLKAWSAILSARAGDRSGALQLLAAIPVVDDTATLLVWARQAVAAATVHAARAATPRGSPGGSTTPSEAAWTPLQEALQAIGAQLAHGALDDVRRDVRALLQSVATGGTFDQSNRPETLGAARSVLAAVLGVMAIEHGAPDGRAFDARTDPHGRWHITASVADAAPAPKAASPGLRSSVLQALRAGDLDLADALLQKLPSAESVSVVDALRQVVTGAHRARISSHGASPTDDARSGPQNVPNEDVGKAALSAFGNEEIETSEPLAAVQPGALRAADPLLAPVRIGLSLLHAPSQPVEANVSVPHQLLSGAAVALAADSAGVRHSSTSAALGERSELRSEAGEGDSTLAETFESGKRLRALALGCMALAFASMVYGYGVAAIALAGGASWLALRSSTVAAVARRAARDEAEH